ncbi:hypothetical protein B0H10DRAFT_1994540 [Mycena sp. CBHHK59/15]|nr:hypothetical protein B0H10DRAFT_1994540 [Mycena sp. CBHHK59/15]
MTMQARASRPQATYPLTVFDKCFERTAFVTGWLVQGVIDTDALAAALGRMSEKWRMLAGRLEIVPESKTWQISVPLGPLPADYKTYALTISTSELPLSHYLTLPLEGSSACLPHSLFLHPTTPRGNAAWVATSHPLTCWNITHFPSHGSDVPAYTCIGFARSHGVFDGVGAAAVMRALVAEMDGKEWSVPSSPPEGSSVNPLETVLTAEVARTEGQKEYRDSPVHSVLGFWGILWAIGWQFRERFWRGATQRIFTIPKGALNVLVDGVKSELRSENHSEEVTTGDILTAWIMKAVYATGTPPAQLVHCSNFASFRDIVSESGGTSFAGYPHNAFIPLPYPVLSVQELNALSVPAFARLLCAKRHEFSLRNVVAAYHVTSHNKVTMPMHRAANESLVVSNVSASRILETDWSAVGSQGTVCGYRYVVTPNNLVLCNVAYISGRLADGSTVLDVNLNTVRMQNFTNAVRELIARAAA